MKELKKHSHYLQKALELAKIRQGFCAPNPSVGAIVVKNDRIIATGYHYASGQAHAEVEALQQLSDNDIDDTTILYVTLEPCCHHGKTPPCTDYIINKKIRYVYYGYQDPNPRVAGKGSTLLNNSSIKCTYVPYEPIADFYRSYTYWTNTSRPWVTAKLAISLDAKIAGPNGMPVKITGSELQQFTHERRKKSDAILTTVRTIHNDNPQMNVRLNNEVLSKPIYILDSSLTIPNESQIFKTASMVTLFYSCSHQKRLDELHDRGVRTILIDKDENQMLSLQKVMDTIGHDGIHDLWIESGGVCFQNILKQKLAQRCFIYVSPTFLGNAATPAFMNSFEDIFKTVTFSKWHSFERDAVCEINFGDKNVKSTLRNNYKK